MDSISIKVSLIYFFIFFSMNLSDAKNQTSYVMKIQRNDHPRQLLKYNVEQDQRSSTLDGDESYIPYDLQIVVDAFKKLNYSSCTHDALIVMDAINKREKWALQMFDASSKFPVGLLQGQFYQFGNFDECVELKQPVIHTEDTPIRGQYCLADVELFNRKKYDGRVARSFEISKNKSRNMLKSIMYWGICMPSSCTTNEIKIVIQEIFTLAFDRKKINVRLTDDKCHINKYQPFTKLEIIYGCATGMFLVFIILATVFHFYILQQKKKSSNYNIESNGREPANNKLKEIVLCFSIFKTTRKFLQTKSSGLNLECVGGMKFLSMMFIVSGHTLLFMVGGPVNNTDFLEKERSNVVNAIFTNSPLLVDTFLLISGFLLSYLLLVEFNKRKRGINFAALYVARYIRLTPSYLVVIGIYCTYLFRMSSGPLWNSRIKKEQERCLKSWWTNLLYINNYVNTNDMCMFQSWYLAVDYHLFIISPFIIYSLWKWPKVGKCILGILTIGSILVTFVITFKDKLDPTLMIYASEVYDISENFYFKSTYIKTHMRAGSYFLGLFFGYLLHKLKSEGIKIPKYIKWFGWVLSSICGIISMFSVIIFYFPYHEYNVFEAAVYASLHRIAWCVFVGWVIIMCTTDNAPLINGFLSWKPFTPLSRLTYCAYLTNGFVELYSLGSIREGTYMNKYELTNKIFSHLILTFLIAFWVCILFESPIHGLEKIILGKANQRRPTVNNTDVVNNDSTNHTRVPGTWTNLRKTINYLQTFRLFIATETTANHFS